MNIKNFISNYFSKIKNLNKKCLLYIIGSIVGVVITIWLIGLYIFQSEIQNYIQNDKTAEAIVVFTGGSNRIATGLELLKNKKADKLFISGVYHSNDIQNLFYIANYAPHLASCCIALGKSATNTFENAEETKAWLEENSINSILLVTSIYHIQRAKNELETIMPKMNIIPYPVRGNRYDANNKMHLNVSNILLLNSEFIKTIWVYSRNKLKKIFN